MNLYIQQESQSVLQTELNIIIVCIYLLASARSRTSYNHLYGDIKIHDQGKIKAEPKDSETPAVALAQISKAQ